jgi:hypothetical protein
MAHAALARAKINTEVTQPSSGRVSRSPAGRRSAGRPPKGPRVSGEARDSVRQPAARVVVEVGWGILVPAGGRGGAVAGDVHRERAAQVPPGRDRGEARCKLEKVTERLSAGTGNAERTGAELIAHTWTRADCRRTGSGRASTPTPSGGCAKVRRPGHQHGHLPGHHGRPHAADRQRAPTPGKAAGPPG